MIDVTPRAKGVTPGMTLEEALSIHTDALVLEADEPHYSKVFSQILTSLQAISDRVEGSDLGTAYVRLDGLGAPARWRSPAGQRSPECRTPDLAPRVGVAQAKFPAFVAATVSQPSRATRGPCRCNFVPGLSPRQPAPRLHPT